MSEYEVGDAIPDPEQKWLHPHGFDLCSVLVDVCSCGVVVAVTDRERHEQWHALDHGVDFAVQAHIELLHKMIATLHENQLVMVQRIVALESNLAELRAIL